MPKYFCEYCGIYLTHSSPGGRLQHSHGRKHISNKIEYYSQFLNEFKQINTEPNFGLRQIGQNLHLGISNFILPQRQMINQSLMTNPIFMPNNFNSTQQQVQNTIIPQFPYGLQNQNQENKVENNEINNTTEKQEEIKNISSDKKLETIKEEDEPE